MRNIFDVRSPISSHMLLVEVVIIVRQIAQANKPFHRIVQLDEHAEARHAADDAIEFLADLIQHELAFLQLLGVALRIDGYPLPLRRLLRNVRHPRRERLLPRSVQRPPFSSTSRMTR